MPSAAEKIADRFLRRDLDLQRFLKGARRETIRRIDALARELQQLVYRFDPSGPVQIRHRELRVKRLLAEAAKVIREAYAEIGTTHRDQARLLAAIEGKGALAAVNAGLGADVVVVPLSRSQIASIASNVMVEAAPVREWWSQQSKATAARFAAQIRRGMTAGETVQQLTRRIQDTKGFLQATRAQAETLARTGFQAVAQDARRTTFENNADVIKAIQQRSTLDTRTSEICIAYSGAQWSLPDYEPIGHDLPYNGGTPRHFNCRSAEIPITKSWDELRGRRLKGGQGRPQQGVDARFRDSLRRQGLSEAAVDRAVMNAQASMDGQVPDDWTFTDWLERQSVTRQKQVLGQGRWELWSDGKITTRDLIDDLGRPLTLDELKARL